MQVQETWYVLEDGSSANPNEVVADKNGVLRHKSGMSVAIGAHGNPRSRGVFVDDAGNEIGAKPKPAADKKVAADKKPGPADRQVKADPKAGAAEYKTR